MDTFRGDRFCAGTSRLGNLERDREPAIIGRGNGDLRNDCL